MFLQPFLSFPLWIQLLILYLLVINLITFFAFGMDKMQSSIEGARRTSEKTLWFLCFLGGSIGGLLGMNFFRHKTKKTSFQAVLIIIVALQMALIFWLISVVSP